MNIISEDKNSAKESHEGLNKEIKNNEKQEIPNPDEISFKKSNDQDDKKSKKRPCQNLLLQKLKKQRLKETSTTNSINASEAHYYFQNGLRKVYPYLYTYTTYCKGRWVGKSLIQVFSEEFRAHSKEDYEEFIKKGTLTVNGEKVEPSYILKDNDFVANVVHRHESPVLASPIKILHQTDQIVVIDKPPSIPVHTCGKYRHNTLVSILANEHGLDDLYLVHRLDRLTSGLMIFTRSSGQARAVIDQIFERRVHKEYVCRVEGEFPSNPITCDEPIDILSQKMGVCIVAQSGKPATTEFIKLSYNGKSSVVLCKPLTGRMHQIRVHLQYLGHPIINDPIYNNHAFGPKKGKNGDFGKTKEELISELLNLHTMERWLEDGIEPEDDGGESDISGKSFLSCLSPYMDDQKFKQHIEQNAFNPALMTHVPTCKFCTTKTREPRPQDLIMFLHALRYKGQDWSYETEMPLWASESWTDF